MICNGKLGSPLRGQVILIMARRILLLGLCSNQPNPAGQQRLRHALLEGAGLVAAGLQGAAFGTDENLYYYPNTPPASGGRLLSVQRSISA